ncbi:uncharacterized protein PV09_02840 [Verruconis gallopava]|uniref:Uncharacterized protein n=1 Tax=Verruconis gallopava TaxID=253628 RepID=A0A0D1Z096_9PEZI|nr:uncharacterized protein PV09_02840 [Verruconis gallopava]KIW06387.1 hypothetical protein PV09_02840 [Verruconis gallopava]
MKAPTLSFGVELEGLLVFHETLLAPHVPAGLRIKKDRTPQEAYLYGSWPRILYPGWAFEDSRGQLQPYGDEPPQIASKLLESAENLPSVANGKFKRVYGEEQKGASDRDEISESGKASMDISESSSDEKAIDERRRQDQWIVKQDISIASFTPEDKYEVLTGPKFANVSDWDTWGVEFISPVYVADEEIDMMKAHTTELRRHLETPLSTIVETKTCGLHVHVGLPDNGKMPIEVLRVLAFITVMYEDQISLIHDEHRVASREEPIMSNRKKFKQSPSADVDRKFVDEDEVFSTFLAVKEIRRRIFFDAHASQDQAYVYLKELLCTSKQHIINWLNIDGKVQSKDKLLEKRPPTIEFRQHSASFDAEVIEHWVRFCLGLVRLAYELADAGVSCFSDIQTWDDELDLRDLLDQMCLPATTLRYFRDKLGVAIAERREPVVPIWQVEFPCS